MQIVLTPNWTQGIHDLEERINRSLQSDQQVLWLLSGGSNIAASVKVMEHIPKENSNRLHISLADERYGPVGHQNSNWEQLMQAGFESKDAYLEPILDVGKSFEETKLAFENRLNAAFTNNMVTIAQFGIGDDGHIAGILPHSDGSQQTADYVIGYRAEPYLRVSISFTAIRKLTVSYAFAFGKSKHTALTTLVNEDLDPDEQPSQILKQLHEAYVYNDQVGG